MSNEVHKSRLVPDPDRGDQSLIKIWFQPHGQDPATEPVLVAVYALEKADVAAPGPVFTVELLSVSREDTREPVSIPRSDLQDVREVATSLAVEHALEQDGPW